MTVTTRMVPTDRLEVHVHESGPADGTPVVLVHGNLATGRFFERIMDAAPSHLRMLAPDMRGFGRTERVPIDATRGLQDWADDTAALVGALGITDPVHLLGWSTGGAAIAQYAMTRPDGVASLTFVDPVSPRGFGGTHGPDGTLNHDDHAGSGGGTGNPDFAAAIAAGDRGTDSPLSPRNVLRTSYWATSHTVDPAWEDVLVDEVLLSDTGEDGYPGDFVASDNWPGVAPGTRGILNALSSKYCDWSGLSDLDPPPPILWTHGSEDVVISNQSAWDLAVLGQSEVVPGWPGPDVCPAQPMVDQVTHVMQRCRGAGADVTIEHFEGSGHAPFIDAQESWQAMFFDFLTEHGA